MFARGHCLLVACRGWPRRSLIRTLADALSWSSAASSSRRPDALRHHGHRGDSGGSGIGQPRVPLLKGPIFGNVNLADEINRTPPKTQAALLEAMQGISDHRRRAAAPARPAVLRPGHPEPHRARGHLPLPEPNWTASCSTPTSTTRKKTRSSTSYGGPRPTSRPR